MRFFCLFLLVYLMHLPNAQADDSDCWKKSGDAAIKACSNIINSKHKISKGHDKKTISLAYFHRGNAYYIKRFYNRAIVNYDAAIRLNPKFVKAFHIRGNAYFLQDDFDKAIKDFDQVLRLDPNYTEVTYYRELTLKKLRLKRELEQKN